jgi:uncharacterized membrane protein YeaQ/YmgE (transglycosylase-associated protein family)
MGDGEPYPAWQGRGHRLPRRIRTEDLWAHQTLRSTQSSAVLTTSSSRGRLVLILAILVLGLAAGWVANLLVGRGEPANWTQLFLVGIAGSFVGGLVSSLIFGDGLDLRPSGLIGSILGATLVLFAVRAVSGRRAH